MIEWKDETSYSQGDRGKIDPRTWEAIIAGLRVVVTRYQGIKDEWFASCLDLKIDYRELGPDLEAAKGKALAIVQERVVERRAQCDAFLSTVENEAE